MNDVDAMIQATIPVAEALVAAAGAGDRDRIAELLADVAFPETLMIMLAAAVNPLLLEDADFTDVQYDHPSLSYHAGRYENGDRDTLAIRCYVHRISIPDTALAAGTIPGRRTAS